MASGPTTAWKIEGEKVEVVTDFLFLVSKITVDGDWSHEIRQLFLGREAMTNLDSVLKSRDVTLLTKVHIVKAMVFPVVTFGCETWTIKKEERQRIDAFELWCWRRQLKVPWTVKRSNQSIFFFFFFYFYFIFKLYKIVSKWIHHRYTCVPHPKPSSLLPPHTIPLGHSSAPAPSIQYCASNLDWQLISYMILYMFQCHSPKSSHPLSQS